MGGARRSIGWAKAGAAAVVAKTDSYAATDVRLRTIAMASCFFRSPSSPRKTRRLEYARPTSRRAFRAKVAPRPMRFLPRTPSLARLERIRASSSSWPSSVAQDVELTQDRGEMYLEALEGHSGGSISIGASSAASRSARMEKAAVRAAPVAC